MHWLEVAQESSLNHGRLTMRSRTLTALTAIAALAGAACSDDDPSDAPLTTGTVTASLTDAPSASALAAGQAAQLQSAFSGTFSGDARVEIYSEANGWVEVANEESAQVDLGGSAQTAVGSNTEIRADVPYSRVRLTITGGQAVIDAGAILGGLTLLADVTLSLGTSGDVVIEKDVTPFTVQADATSTLQIDLNSELWVTESNATAEAVAEAEMAAVATVVVM